MARKKCKMCKVKRKVWETDNFFGVQCNKHFVPMIISKEHKRNITEEEKKEVLKIIKERYKGLFIDTTVSDSDEHWHLHLSKRNKKSFI